MYMYASIFGCGGKGERGRGENLILSILWFQVQAMASFVCSGSCGDCHHISAHSLVSH